jgi:hypothetical protein
MSVWLDVRRQRKEREIEMDLLSGTTRSEKYQPAGGLARWLLQRLRRVKGTEPRLALLDRLSLTPRHSVALIVAEGRKLLVATSPEGPAAFCVLDASVPSTFHDRSSVQLGG